MAFQLHSIAFHDNKEIPRRYTGEGKDLSPPLRWTNIPRGAKELALICEDPDAPQPQPWIHWVLYKIPTHGPDHLQEGIHAKERLEAPPHALQGKNSFGRIGYGGPMPPVGHGWHHYHFHLYALGSELNLPPGATRDQLVQAMNGHILGQTSLTGLYKRGPAPEARAP